MITTIFGPPGTGKTTTLIGVVESTIVSGILPDQICYVGFTRRSAQESRDKALELLKLSRDQLPWFLTLHSLSFKMLGLNRNNIMGARDYMSICQTLGLSLTIQGINNEDGTFGGQTKGDRLLFAECMARSRMQTIEEYHNSVPDEDLYLYELKRVRKHLEEYKVHHDKSDFTDIITMYAHGDDPCPPVKALIVDEAQDLSPLQWKLVEKLMSGVDETFIAGDDDQAIFRWAGADVERLIKVPGKRIVLGRSYRVPRKVQEVAEIIVERISSRVPKTWKARDAEGTVDYVSIVEELDMSKGTWLLLARNTYLLVAYTAHCTREGLIFEARGDGPTSGDTFRAIRCWEELRAGKSLRISSIQVVYDHMSSKIGIVHGYKGKLELIPDNEERTLDQLRANHGMIRTATESWDVALDKIQEQEREYFLSALRRGEKLTDRPRIRVSTIHGAKGAEADNVVLQLDMADRTYREMENSPDDEHRVWYVGVTRARERLIIIQPQTNRCYAL